MSDITRLDKGPRMSQSVIHNGMVYLAGQVGRPDGDVQAQTRDILARIEDLLGQSGSDKSRILSANIWLTDMNDFGAMNEVWDAWVDPANPPARACVEAKLASPELLVEVMVIATQS
jgi:enamine deaminase RidA (YjgF/YER057c/UK114 family)